MRGSQQRAYPRSRGATFRLKLCNAGVLGLSPLARGNQYLEHAILCAFGPIPARAGQPYFLALAGVLAGAYPRSRGATPYVHHFGAV